LNSASNNKKQENSDNPSGPYAIAGSIAATMRNSPTKLMSNLSKPPLCNPFEAIFAPPPAYLG
jgi:hypothetical protein